MLPACVSREHLQPQPGARWARPGDGPLTAAGTTVSRALSELLTGHCQGSLLSHGLSNTFSRTLSCRNTLNPWLVFDTHVMQGCKNKLRNVRSSESNSVPSHIIII